MPQEFKLQDPGEGVREVDILEVLVAEGDTVSEGQDLLTVESDKAAIELPSPFDGTISEIRVKEGDTAVVGDVLIVFEDAATDADTLDEEPEDTAETERAEEKAEPDEDEEREDAPSEDRSGKDETDKEKSAGEDHDEQADKPEKEADTAATSCSRGRDGKENAPVRASPAARKLAEERGVDLAELEPSGVDGQVTVEDVKDAASRDHETKAAQSESETERKGEEMPASARNEKDEDEFGPVERQRMSSIRAATARMTARSWNRIPHVVHEDAADITEFELWRRKHGGDAPSLMPVVAKAVSILLQDHPRFNAILDTDSDEIVLRHYCNINIAVATDRGLVTPVVREVDRKSVRDLASEMSQIAQKARDRKLRKSDTEGGTFTITNIGSLGGRSLSPIINEPQTAILGLGRARVEAVPLGDIGEGSCEVETRMILPLAVAFDHRVIDGADAARFTNDLMALLRDPVSLALEA